MHRSLVPLAKARTDELTAAEWKARQAELDVGTNIDGDIGAVDYEENPAGCSPYGCRTTEVPAAAGIEAAA
ncbi:hypothetical protein [Thermomonospora umbrina]|uniref:Uncharacterized protein n=1 Tax=Thermomonospora umbrina TaxID=111806 RepID=A0A3D9SX36_9ACTN|nr:hypothetical protein [Thermomonospora umbrina]REF00523.1 hypothetical protein DFJ69_6068 [Thermomonospora umbrina]